MLFFAIISMVGFTVLRILSSLSRKRKNKIAEHSESKEPTEQQPVNIFTANGNIQAEMILFDMVWEEDLMTGLQFLWQRNRQMLRCR